MDAEEVACNEARELEERSWITVTFASNADTSESIELHDESGHVADLLHGEEFVARTRAAQVWTMHCAGCVLRTWTIQLDSDGARLELPATTRMPRRTSRATARREQWRPADEDDREQWGGGQEKRPRGPSAHE